MRPTERIDNFLEKVDKELLAIRWFGNEVDPEEDYYININNEVIKYWKENPDQRIGQVLINLNILPDNFKIWNDEENDILKAQGLPPEEYLFWGSNYDKDMNRIPLIYRLIKDLDTDHINAIYDHILKAHGKLSEDYKIAFRNVLVSRNENTNNIDRIEHIWNEEELFLKDLDNKCSDLIHEEENES
jgi:hypothetical protein